MHSLRFRAVGVAVLVVGAASAAPACREKADSGRPYPAVTAWGVVDAAGVPQGRTTGPGGPKTVFTDDQLWKNCSPLDGDKEDKFDHHNLVQMFDGWLVLPWAPEWGKGGISFFDVSAPCEPKVIAHNYSAEMRETHSIGWSFQGGGRWAVVNQIRRLERADPQTFQIFAGGLEFWDVSDVRNARVVSKIELPLFNYPDAYRRVTLGVTWQAPYVYVAAGDTGVHIVDASDPLNPVFVKTYTFEPVLRTFLVQAIGNLLIVGAGEGPRVELLDISDPVNPVQIPGGSIVARDAAGIPREAYAHNFANHHVYFARKSQGGGLIVVDIQDPTKPVQVGNIATNGNGGYVFVHEEYAFVGESNFANVYDIRDLANISQVGRLNLKGDLDTVTPIGNVAVLSVDDRADANVGSAIAPWAKEPDTNPPKAVWAHPLNGSTGNALTSRIGVSFNEFIEPVSVFEGSFRVYETGTNPAKTRVDGVFSVYEVIANFHPEVPLKPNTSYTVEIPAGGIVDYNGNPVATPFTATFTTGAR